jgi:hypothetical protein
MNEETIACVWPRRHKKKKKKNIYIYIYRYRAGTTRENKSKGGLEWFGTNWRASSLYCPSNTDKWRLQKGLESCVFLVLYTVTKRGHSRRRKKDASKLSAEEGRENRYRLTDAEVRQATKTKDIVEVAHSVKWKWRAHVTGIVQRGWAHVTSTWCLRIGKRRMGRPKTWWSDTSKCAARGQRLRVTKSQKLERMAYTQTTSVN